MRKVLLAAATIVVGQPALAAEITVNDVYHFVDRIGTRSWAGTENEYALTFGVYEINLDSSQGTSGTYEQNGVTGDLIDYSSSITKELANRLPYDENLTGSWTLTLENDGDTAVFNTPEVGSAVAPDYITSVSQSGPATTPTFTFIPPDGLDRVDIEILDLKEARKSVEVPDSIFKSNLDGGASSFTVPDGVLEDGGTYSVAFQADTYRPGMEFSLLGRSRVFYDFVAGGLPDTGGVPVYLPTTDTTSGTPIFNFDNPVVKEELAYFDPLVAIGYDYFIGEEDPLFNSVLLPDIGDGRFDLFLSDGSGGFDFSEEVLAGSEYFFEGGVEYFRILGIEIAAGLDPEDPTAFVTGLSFVEDGQFTGSMTPITVEVAPIPLPAAGWLLFAAIAGLGTLSRKCA